MLAASLQGVASRAELTLQVLEAATQRVLRKARISSASAEISTLADKASQAAARLLGLPAHEKSLKDPDELNHVSREVYQVFSEAEQLAKEPNNTGLDEAMRKYQQAVEMASPLRAWLREARDPLYEAIPPEWRARQAR